MAVIQYPKTLHPEFGISDIADTMLKHQPVSQHWWFYMTLACGSPHPRDPYSGTTGHMPSFALPPTPLHCLAGQDIYQIILRQHVLYLAMDLGNPYPQTGI